jgi:hypothetical protein
MKAMKLQIEKAVVPYHEDYASNLFIDALFCKSDLTIYTLTFLHFFTEVIIVRDSNKAKGTRKVM